MSISQSIVPLYAAVLALMLVALSIRVILLRDRNQVSLGDGGHAGLQRAIRVQGNFAEYVPFALLLFWFLEQAGAAAPWLHGLCSALPEAGEGSLVAGALCSRPSRPSAAT